MSKFWGEIEGPSMDKAEELVASMQGMKEFARFSEQSDEQLDAIVEGVMLLQTEESKKQLGYQLEKLKTQAENPDESDPEVAIKRRILEAFERRSNQS